MREWEGRGGEEWRDRRRKNGEEKEER